MLKDNPLYKEIFHSKVHDKKFYAPANDGDYHMSRYIAAGAQNVYSASGATKELLERYIDKIVDICNNERNKDTIRTDIGTLCNNLKYRMRYPVDEDCALRMGAVYCIMEGEDPDTVNPKDTERKVSMAKGVFDKNIPADPDLYAFFLSIGLQSTPSWKEYEADISNLDYFKDRNKALETMTLPA